MTRLSIDFEHPSKLWWESGGRDLWAGIAGDPDEVHVTVDDAIAASWLKEAGRLPGWDEGPAWAPHPINARPADADDPEI